MRYGLIMVLTAGATLAGCGDSGPPPKRQPGSWTSKIEILKLEGQDVQPQMRESMQKMFDAMAAVSVCVTPEAAAAEDVSKNIEDSAGGRNCTFDKRVIAGEKLDFAGTCTDAQGQKVRMVASGRNGATAQDITVKVEPVDGTGKAKGVMEMRVTSKRTGECKPGDITPPPQDKAAPAPATK